MNLSQNMGYVRWNFSLQLFISVAIMMLQYIQVLSLYECGRWACSGVPLGAFTVLFANMVICRRNLSLNVPIVVAHFFGIAGLLFWSIEWWNTSTRHRTEYLDTHTSYFSILFMACPLNAPSTISIGIQQEIHKSESIHVDVQ